MASYTLSPVWGAGAQLFTNNGVPLSGGKIFVYFAGTTTPATTYTSPDGTVANTNPIILDAAGRPPNEIWFLVSSSYKFVLKTSADVLLATYDNIPSLPQPPISNSASSISYNTGYLVTAGNFTVGATYQIASVGTTDFVSIGASANLTNVLFTATGIGTGTGNAYFVRSVESKLRDFVDVKDFGAVGDGTTDDTVAIQAALTFAGTENCAVYVPGTSAGYRITAPLNMQPRTTVFGDGYGSFINQVTPDQNAINAGSASTIRDLRIKVADGTNSAFASCVNAVNIDNVTVQNNFLEPGDLGGCGVYIAGVQQSLVANNRIYGGKWSSGAGFAASASDIILYSSGQSERHVIDGNFCLSNNSQGIFVDALGYDGDIIVTNNECVTLEPSTCIPGGTWALAASGGVRRHGIVVGYNSSAVSGPRCVVDGNICRNTRWTGIYKQGVSSGSVIISNNLCDLNGYQAGNSLSGGIYVIQSGYELVTGNTVTNFQNTTQATGGITLNATTVATIPSTVSNNYVRGSLGRGITASTNTALLEISGNTLVSNANIDIEIIANPSLATICGHNIVNNRIYRTSGTDINGILVNAQSSTLTLTIKNNTIRGNDNTTADTENAGISVRQATDIIQILNNKISNFYYGVYSTAYYTAGRMVTVLYEGNVLEDCAVGFALSATNNNQTVPLVNNRFINTTTLTSGPLGFVAGRIVQRIGELLVWQTTATPTAGSWAVGDRSMNSTPVVGQPKSWVCTVAGTPGTWVSEGNL